MHRKNRNKDDVISIVWSSLAERCMRLSFPKLLQTTTPLPAWKTLALCTSFVLADFWNACSRPLKTPKEPKHSQNMLESRNKRTKPHWRIQPYVYNSRRAATDKAWWASVTLFVLSAWSRISIRCCGLQRVFEHNRLWPTRRVTWEGQRLSRKLAAGPSFKQMLYGTAKLVPDY